MIEIFEGDSNTVCLAKTMLNIGELIDSMGGVDEALDDLQNEGVRFASEVLNDIDPETYSLDDARL